MANTISSFTAGDLVVSVSGDGDGSGTYGDNQASPITLNEFTLNGTASANLVGQFVLPQTATTVNNVAESAISGEYGSSSEGTLQLSGDGGSLVIAGYGVNAAAYNGAEAGMATGPYGSPALAQTTSVPGNSQGYTVVPRVVADINAAGVVDTSTSLTNIYNLNNPRSVTTADGTSFYLSGQGNKDNTQGVFSAADGATGNGAHAINVSIDTRIAELYNGTLYVSQDSSQAKNTGNISSYAADGTATKLPGFTGTVALQAGQGNAINNSTGTVDLSPEEFFFANSSTLYVADGGNPKGGTLGDGGLQKWSLANGTWKLDYTVSAGLNLVANTTAVTANGGTGTNQTTGLIGLTGRVNSDGTVSLYATNSTVGDLNNTYLYGVTDNLASTTLGAGEGFTQLAAAAPGSNIRGVAFAPAAVCYCSGTMIRVARGGEPVEAAVEQLVVGDLAVTASGEHRPIKWIGHRTMDCRDHHDRAAAMPVRVSADAIGPGLPERDLWVSPGHALCLDVLGDVLIPTYALVNGATIAQVDVAETTYWHVELDSHDILIANNLPAESYIDCGNRSFFVENQTVDLEAVPDAARTLADYCRPFVCDGALVDMVRERLRDRAASLGWRLGERSLDDLRLHVDGSVVEPAVDGLAVRFVVPAEAREVRLVCEASAPRDSGFGTDRRALGVDVRALSIGDGFTSRAIALDDRRLNDGFHDPEDGNTHRWTTESAVFPASLWGDCRGMFFLRLDLAQPRLPRWIDPGADAQDASPALIAC